MMTKVCEKLGIDSPWHCTLCAARAQKVWICWGPQLNHWMTRSHRDSEKGGHLQLLVVFFSHRFYPRGKLTQKYGQSPFWRGKSSRSLGHGFHSYVLLEGIQNHRNGRTPPIPKWQKDFGSDSTFVTTKTQSDSASNHQRYGESMRIPHWLEDFPWFSMIFHDFPWFSMIFHDFPWFSMIFHDFPWFSMIFHDFRSSVATRCLGHSAVRWCLLSSESEQPRHEGRIRCILSDK